MINADIDGQKIKNEVAENRTLNVISTLIFAVDDREVHVMAGVHLFESV